MSKTNNKRAVVVTTGAKGVFFGYIESEELGPERSLKLTGIRNCLYWPEEVKGFLGLAVTGPLKGSKVGPTAPESTLYLVTSINYCSEEAEKTWLKIAA